MSRYRVDKADEATYVISERLGGVHCYLLIGGEKALLIDSGNGAGRLDMLIRSLTPLPVTVVNTHGHLDHIGGNHLFKESALPSGEESVTAQHTDNKYIKAAFKKMLPWYLRAAVRVLAPYMIKAHSFNASFSIADGDIIDLGGRQLQVIAIPGHTAHSVCYYDKANGCAFVGDCIVNNTVLLNLDYAEPPETYLRSLNKLKESVSVGTQFFSGHTETPLDYEYLLRFIAAAESACLANNGRKRGSESGKECVYAEKCGVRLALKP